MKASLRRVLLLMDPYAGELLGFIIRTFLAVASVTLLEFLYLECFHHFPDIWQYLFQALHQDLKAVLLLTVLFSPLVCLLLRRKGWYRALVHAPVMLVLLLHTGLVLYYVTVLDLLDKAVLRHSFEEALLVWEEFGGLRAAHLILFLPPLIYLGGVVFFPFSKRMKGGWGILLLLFLFILPFGVSFSIIPDRALYAHERHHELVNNKSLYLVSDLLDPMGPQHPISLEDAVRTFHNSRPGKRFTDPDHPLLHRAEKGSHLDPYFSLKSSPPNLVFIIVEGLGRAISGDGAHLHSFTPFLDSLADKSLYFPHFMSNGERTFSVLPGAFASLPHGPSGFLNVKGKMPEHYSIQSLLIRNGYKGAFFYGGDARYSSYSRFMEQQGVERIYDSRTWRTGPKGEKGSKKGSLNDKELLERGSKALRSIGQKTPYVHTYLTLGMHHPFRFEGQKAYLREVKRKIKREVKNERRRERFLTYKRPLSSVLFMDDALKAFFERYEERPEYGNSIFFIFGDHRFSQMKKHGPLDTYHVPLIVHSPLLKEARTFPAVNSHLDLPPAVISLMRSNYEMDLPDKVPWLGKDLDTSSVFRSERLFPIMLNNGEVEQYLYRDRFLHYGKLYKVQKGLKAKRMKDERAMEKLRKKFRADRIVGEHVVRKGKIVPRSRNDGSERLFSIKKEERKRISSKTSFEMLVEDTLRKDLKELFISVELPLYGELEDLDEEQVPLLVFVVKDPEGEKLFWNAIDLRANAVHEDGTGRVLHSQQRIGEKGNRELKKGQRLKVYFWIRKPSGRSFHYRVRRLQAKGIRE